MHGGVYESINGGPTRSAADMVFSAVAVIGAIAVLTLLFTIGAGTGLRRQAVRENGTDADAPSVVLVSRPLMNTVTPATGDYVWAAVQYVRELERHEHEQSAKTQ